MSWVIFCAGVIIGWIGELFVDFFFWRRRHFDTTSELEVRRFGRGGGSGENRGPSYRSQGGSDATSTRCSLAVTLARPRTIGRQRGRNPVVALAGGCHLHLAEQSSPSCSCLTRIARLEKIEDRSQDFKLLNASI